MTAAASAPKTLLASSMPIRVLGAAIAVALLWVVVALVV